MRRITILLFSLLMFCVNRSFATGNPEQEVLALYQKANHLFYLPEPTDQTDSLALAGFGKLITLCEKRHITDTILFQSYLKKGILLDVKRNYPGARDSYLKALWVHRLNKKWSDSLLFTLTVYTGSVYYNLNQFDSANHFLAAAESLSKQFPGLPEKERLYNVWGALFYESGNYRQSSNYFMQALEIVKSKKPFDKISAINFENNIAASFYRQEQFGQALAIYGRLLKYGLFTNQLWLNMGKAYLAMGNPVQALNCFKKVNPVEVPGVENEMALAYLQLNDPGSAARSLSSFAHRSQNRSGNAKDLDAGIYFFYRARLQHQQKQFAAALTSLQQAVIIFSGRFNNKDISTNPDGFTGSFTSYKLLEALKLKAEIFQQFNTSNRLTASLAAYHSAISLLRYIEKSYDTDDARLLLKKNSKAIYDGAFRVCMQLHQEHPGEQYLEQAFLIAEKSKASVIAQQLKEHQYKQINGIDPVLLQEERQLKYSIARLNVKLDQANDLQASASIVKEKMNVEIELSKLQQEIERNNIYYRLKYEESYPSLKQIQQAIGKEQVLVSLYADTASLHTFVISSNDFRYLKTDSLKYIKQLINTWTDALQTATPGRRFSGQATGPELYQRLVLPILSVTGRLKEWIIIPDDVLHFLPFESLPDNKGAPLLESITTSYHFSSQFIVPQFAARTGEAPYNVLAMAPFNNSGISIPGHPVLYSLPASINEIKGLPGLQLTDRSATKGNFLQNLNRYPVLHVVTHAVADLDNSGGSFLAFYPDKGKYEDNRLYADEIYGLNMDATELVILSACETGQGKLINGEGVMSLSRGFAYAGCASIINSLWKADDKASSVILKRFHHHLQQGHSRAKALQLAKLDYLHSDALYKTPDYWANFVLLGNTGPMVKRMPLSISFLYFLIFLFLSVPYCFLLPALRFRIFRSSSEKPFTLSA
ncbi:CHAT domain-containing protein [Pseudoflavitalea rhizosphaerae]|uniref:CHAT domain-containing protein n=1 Tax=Pseudoflavitalea rhizosphaerae TaxID=1884793 RepID=UPI000F8D4639|nr:CHAT domain-containing tetratricopeptide repeat protein [Pseudoflavitalea rhizosphaerae]